MWEKGCYTIEKFCVVRMCIYHFTIGREMWRRVLCNGERVSCCPDVHIFHDLLGEGELFREYWVSYHEEGLVIPWR